MTIKAHLDDGRILEFPDGTDPNVIQQTVKKVLGQSAPQQAAAMTQPTPPHTPTPGPIKGKGLGAFLPASVTRQGNLQWDTPPIWDAAVNALTVPGDVSSGRVSPFSATPEGKVGMNNDVQKRLMNLAILAGPINPAVRAGDLAIPGEKTSLTRATPTPETLMTAGAKGFDKARSMNVDFSPEAVGSLARDIESNLYDKGLPPTLAPATSSILKELQQPPEGAVFTGNDLIALRQSLQNTAQSNAKAANKDYAAAVSAIKALDEFVSGAADSGAATGPLDAFQQTYEAARANSAASFRAIALEKKQTIAEFRAAAAGSGRNLGNNLRQRLTDLLANPEKIRGWSDEERAALEAIVNGSTSMNAWRTLSNRLGGGGGAVSSILAGAGGASGYAIGGPAGAAVGTALPIMAGTGSRKIYNTMVNNAVDQLEQMLLQRSPEFEHAAATVADNPTALANLMRTMLLLPKTPPEKPTSDVLYLSAKKNRDALEAANDRMRRGLRP